MLVKCQDGHLQVQTFQMLGFPSVDVTLIINRLFGVSDGWTQQKTPSRHLDNNHGHLFDIL